MDLYQACKEGNLQLIVKLVAKKVTEHMVGNRENYYNCGMAGALSGHHIEIYQLMIELGGNDFDWAMTHLLASSPTNELIQMVVSDYYRKSDCIQFNWELLRRDPMMTHAELAKFSFTNSDDNTRIFASLCSRERRATFTL